MTRLARPNGCMLSGNSSSVSCDFSTTFQYLRLTTSGQILGSGASRRQDLCGPNRARRSSSAASSWPPTPATSCSTRPAVPAPPLCRRAMGPPLDHDRHLACRAGAGPRPHHGRALSLIICWPIPRRPAQGSGDHAHRSESQPTHGNIRHGFVYERVPHITLKSIANNAEIDVIWEKWQATLEPLREQLNAALKQTWQEWEIPREADANWPDAAQEAARRMVGGAHRPAEGDRRLHRRQGRVRIPLRQALRGQEKVRVAGPFTVESLSPHRVLGVDENDELIDAAAQTRRRHRRRAATSRR